MICLDVSDAIEMPIFRGEILACTGVRSDLCKQRELDVVHRLDMSATSLPGGPRLSHNGGIRVGRPLGCQV
jgi:hypothetical protein